MKIDWKEMSDELMETFPTEGFTVKLMDCVELPNERFFWSDNYDGKCGNCHKSFHEDEKYCRYCGTKRGEGKFEPYKINMDFQCIYGPMPVKRTRQCAKCGYSWETNLMVDDEKYCPQCGGVAEIVGADEQKSEWSFRF